MSAVGLSSSIRTVTVGSGISPDLLTSPQGHAASARGLPSLFERGLPPVGNCTLP
jgi:hypothetical protein